MGLRGGFPVRGDREGGADPGGDRRRTRTPVRGRGDRAGQIDRHLRPAMLEATLGRSSPFAKGRRRNLLEGLDSEIGRQAKEPATFDSFGEGWKQAGSEHEADQAAPSYQSTHGNEKIPKH